MNSKSKNGQVAALKSDKTKKHSPAAKPGTTTTQPSASEAPEKTNKSIRIPSLKERRKMQQTILKHLEARLGVWMYMGILKQASLAMLKAHDTPFFAEGLLTYSGEEYLKQAMDEVFRPEYDSGGMDAHFLGMVFTEECFRFFEAEQAAEQAGQTTAEMSP